jgi:hypothetical protein
LSTYSSTQYTCAYRYSEYKYTCTSTYVLSTRDSFGSAGAPRSQAEDVLSSGVAQSSAAVAALVLNGLDVCLDPRSAVVRLFVHSFCPASASFPTLRDSVRHDRSHAAPARRRGESSDLRRALPPTGTAVSCGAAQCAAAIGLPSRDRSHRPRKRRGWRQSQPGGF